MRVKNSSPSVVRGLKIEVRPFVDLLVSISKVHT